MIYRVIEITHSDGDVTVYDIPDDEGTSGDLPQRHEPNNPDGNPYISWAALRRALACAKRDGRTVKEHY